MTLCQNHKGLPDLKEGECTGCEVEALRSSLKKVQAIAKKVLDASPSRWQEGFQAGKLAANGSWEEGWRFGKEQERLREEENAAFTEQIMKLEEKGVDAPWLTLAHMICTEQGIPQGHIEARLKVLRDALENIGEQS